MKSFNLCSFLAFKHFILLGCENKHPSFLIEEEGMKCLNFVKNECIHLLLGGIA
jgi:hypothetical protein